MHLFIDECSKINIMVSSGIVQQQEKRRWLSPVLLDILIIFFKDTQISLMKLIYLKERKRPPNRHCGLQKSFLQGQKLRLYSEKGCMLYTTTAPKKNRIKMSQRTQWCQCRCSCSSPAIVSVRKLWCIQRTSFSFLKGCSHKNIWKDVLLIGRAKILRTYRIKDQYLLVKGQQK